MKRFVLILLVFTLFQIPVHAQGFYFSLDGGYGLKMFSDVASNTHDYSNNTYKRELVRYSFGQGLYPALTAGYFFKENLGFEVRFSYLLGSKIKTNYINDDWDFAIENLGYARMININPSIVLMFGQSSIKPVFKAGMIFGAGNVFDEITIKSSSSVDFYKIKTNGGVAFGFNTSLGILWKMNDHIYFTADWFIQQMQYSPKKSEIIEYTEDGRDKLDELDTSEKITLYVDKITDEDNQSDNEPSKALKIVMPFGSMGLRFGLQFRF